MSMFKDITIGESFYHEGHLWFKHTSTTGIGSQGTRSFEPTTQVY